MLVELLLGHNSTNHIFGSASSWIPEEACDELRPILDRYLDSIDIKLLEFSEPAKKSRTIQLPTPTFNTESQAYEGRELEKERARQFARTAILQALNLDIFDSSKTESKEQAEKPDRRIRWVEIDEDAVNEICLAADEILAFDERAKAQVRQVLAEMFKGWWKGKSYRISAASINLIRTDSGPIEVAFARRRAIFIKLCEALPSTVSNYLNRSNITDSERLGALSVMLVINDAVLASVDLKALISAAQETTAWHLDGQIELCATVTSRTRTYDRVVDLTNQSTAALIGYLENRTGTGEETWEEIQTSAHNLLSTFKNCPSLTLSQLIECSRAFWFLKMPGSAYSAAKSDLPCNAPSEYSMQKLMGAHVTSLQWVPPESEPVPTVVPKQKDIKRTAYLAIIKLTSGSAKYFENHEGRSSTQRIDLTNCLEALKKDDDFKLALQLPLLMEKYKVVEVMLDFISYLIAVGGPRKKFLGFGTINKYIIRIGETIISHAWTSDLRKYTQAKFDDMYNEVIEAKESTAADVITALNIFHDFMRNQFNAPPCNRFPSALRKPVRSRNSLPMPDSIDEAIFEALSRKNTKQEIRDAAACLIATSSAFGKPQTLI